MGLLSRLLGTEGATRDLLADLSEDYRAEAAQAVLLRSHAERARYPQAASALRDLADIEDRHPRPAPEWPPPPPSPHLRGGDQLLPVDKKIQNPVTYALSDRHWP